MKTFGLNKTDWQFIFMLLFTFIPVILSFIAFAGAMAMASGVENKIFIALLTGSISAGSVFVLYYASGDQN